MNRNQIEFAKRSLAAMAGVETRRLYHFENTCPLLKPLYKKMKLDDIMYHSKKIWRTVFYFGNYTNFPDVSFGPGTKHNRRMTSYYHTIDHRIELAPNEREMLTMTHELIHAKGRDYHDIEFVFQEFNVFGNYFQISLAELSDAADEYQISYQPHIS